VSPELLSSIGLDDDTLARLKAGGPDAVDSLKGVVERIKQHAPGLGVPHDEVQKVEYEAEAAQRVKEAAHQARMAAPDSPQLQDLMQYKDMLVNGPSETLKKAFPAILPALMAVAPGIVPRLTDLAKKVMGSGQFNETIGRELGLTEEKPEVEAREAVPAGVGAGREAERRAAPPPEAGGTASWLIPLLLIGAIALGAWALWPRHQQQVAEYTPSGIERQMPSRQLTPSNLGAGPLTITDVRVTREGNSTIVTWVTNRPATGQVTYGKTHSYEMGTTPRVVGTGERDLVRTHAMRLTGLSKGTHYFRVTSKDAGGNKVVSKERTIVVR
jgi:hypothetical protein